MPYEAGDITSDAYTNTNDEGYYDISGLSEANVKLNTPFGRGQTGSYYGSDCISTGADATSEDIAKDKTADLSCSGTLTIGALELSGNAKPEEVVKDQTFYNESFSKLTGTYEEPTGPMCSGAVRYRWEFTGPTHHPQYCKLDTTDYVGICDASNVGVSGLSSYAGYSCGVPQSTLAASKVMYGSYTGGNNDWCFFAWYKCHRLCDTDG